MSIINFTKILLLYIVFIPYFSARNLANNDIKNKTNIFLKNKSELAVENNKKNNITIENLRDILIENNKELKILKNKIEQSSANYRSKLAAWYPRFYLNSNDLPKYTNGNDFNKLTNDTSTDKLSIGINTNIDWDIVNPNRRLEINIAKEELTNSENILKSKENDLYLEATKLFYKIQAAYQEIKVAKKSIDISNIALSEAEEKYKAGIGNKLEVLEAKTQLDRDQIKLAKSEGELRTNKNSLFLILNINEKYSVPSNNESLVNFIWDENFQDSLKAAYLNRIDLKIKNKDISINKKRSLSILSGRKPNLTFYNQYTLGTSWGESNVSSAPDFENQNKNSINTLGMKFSWNIFDGGLIKQKYLSLKIKDEELKEEYDLSKKQIKRQLLDAFINLDISIQNIIYSFNQLKSTEETLKISLKRLTAGLTTQREIINIQADVAEAESNFINAITEYNITLEELERLSLLKKKDLCNSKIVKENPKDNYFYEFIIKNNLNKSCAKLL